MDKGLRLPAVTLLSGFFSYFGTLLLDKLPGGVAVFRNSGVYLPGVFFGALSRIFSRR